MLGSGTKAVISEFSARALGAVLIDKRQVTWDSPPGLQSKDRYFFKRNANYETKNINLCV